jgi:predicted RNase H-like HicB family nuclease
MVEDLDRRVTCARYCPAVRFTAAITEEEGWYVARCLEVEVASQGETFDEARANLAEALSLYFEDQPDVEISGPPVIAPIDVAV